jgi:toxin ParE1/3/4
MTARFSAAALRDLRAAAAWIRRDSPRAAAGLREAVQHAAINIGDYPGIGVERPDWTSLPFRFLAVTGYPYVVAYDASVSPPVIARIVHTSRDLPAALEAGSNP